MTSRHQAFGTVVLVAASLLAACGSAGATFSTTGPCLADGRAPGAYPELEAKVPRSLDGRPPTSVDSGRYCSAAKLGSLASHAVSELRFGGATWDESSGKAASIAVLALADGPLPVAWAEEFYDVGARTAKLTGNIETSRPTLGSAGTVFRLDTLNDLSLQTVVVWQDGSLARLVIVATPVGPGASRADHDTWVQSVVAAAAAVQGGTAPVSPAAAAPSG